jgi:hypothetical protein
VLEFNRVYFFHRGINVDDLGSIHAILVVEGDRSLAEYDVIKLSLEEKVKIKGPFKDALEKCVLARDVFGIDG